MRWFLVALLVTGCSVGVRPLDGDGRPSRSRGRRENGQPLDAQARFTLPREEALVLRVGGITIVVPRLELVRPAGGLEPGEAALGLGVDVLGLRAFADDDAPPPPEPPPPREVERAFEREVERDVQRALEAAERAPRPAP